MNKLTPEKRAQALQMMAEGISLRAATRLTGISRTTLLKLLEDAGRAVTAKLWEMADLVKVLEDWEATQDEPKVS